MDPNILMQINEIYRNEVYSEETLSEVELADINGWVNQLISEGYDLDQFSDEELYEGYLQDLDEELTGERRDYAFKRAKQLIDRSREVGNIINRHRGGRHGISNRMFTRANALLNVATREVGGEPYQSKGKQSLETFPRKRGGSGVKGQPKHTDSTIDHSRSDKSKKDLIDSKIRKRFLRDIKRNKISTLNSTLGALQGNTSSNNIRKFKRTQDEAYNILIGHILDEGYADTFNSAELILFNMSEEWRGIIIEEIINEAYQQPKPIRLMRQLGNIRSDSERFRARANEPGMSKNQRDAFTNVSNKLETRGDRMENVWSKHDPKKVKAIEKMNKSTITVTPIRPRLPESHELDLYDIISEYLVSEGFCDSYEDADVIMANMSEEWRESILESAKDQSDKQIEKGIKTTYKAGNVLDNRHQGRSRGLNKIDPRERDSKVERMRARLDSRRDDLFKERNKREDEKMEKIKKLLGL